MKSAILLFDFDGTIADTFLYMCEISNRICGEFGYNRIRNEDRTFLKGKSSQEIIRFLKVPALKIPAIVARAKKEYAKEIGNIEISEELKDALKKLKDSGVQMGVLSSNSRDNVARVLECNGLDVFDFIHSTSRIWGKNIALLGLLRERNLPKDKIIYIGDEIRDIIAARRLGIRAAAVTWGYNSGEALAAHRPDFQFDHPSGLTAFAGTGAIPEK